MALVEIHFLPAIGSSLYWSGNSGLVLFDSRSLPGGETLCEKTSTPLGIPESGNCGHRTLAIRLGGPGPA
jgi:hypothetical protein